MAAKKETALSGSVARQPDNLRGAVLIVLAMAVLTVEVGIVRWVGPHANISQVVFFRSLGQLMVIGLWCLWRGRVPELSTGRPAMHLARGATSVTQWWLYYIAFQSLDFALSTVLTFATSLFVVVLAGPVLGEKVRVSSWIATLVGFGGVALASGVGTLAVDPMVLVGLIASLFGAVIIFLNRALTRSEDTMTIMTYICLFALGTSAPLALWNWQPLAGPEVAALLFGGSLGAYGMVLTIEAYGAGEAAALAPFPFTRIVFAMAVGYLAFGETPQPVMIAGAIIVMVAALVIARLEQRRRSIV